ncbi:MAG: hypothetical protein JY451_09450 [Erythrobacter sp.]|nr:MAG: hypothetical protein JY451_09450 [Erythrobacter sp.]
MYLTTARATPLIAVALIATVVTQVLYISTGVSGTAGALVLWRSEAVAFLAVALLGFVLVRDTPLVAGGLVLGGLFNVLQVGIGITMFGPLGEGGDPLAPVMGAVLDFAFFIYHAGKIGFAAAAVALGLAAWSGATGLAKILGMLALLAGLAALATNLFALAGGSATFLAGACGTAATLFLALAISAARPAEG